MFRVQYPYHAASSYPTRMHARRRSMSWASIKSRCNMRRAYVASYAAALKRGSAGAQEGQEGQGITGDGSSNSGGASLMDTPEMRNIERKVSVEVALVWRYVLFFFFQPFLPLVV